MPNGEDLKLLAHWARCCAVATRSHRLGVAHMVCGFFKFRESHPAVARAIREVLSREPMDVLWPEVIPLVTGKAEALLGTGVTLASLAFDPALQRVMDDAYRRDPGLSPRAVLQAIYASESPIVSELKIRNAESTGQGIRTSGMFQRLESARVQAERMREELGSVVLGQERAVDMLANGYFQACATHGPQGPRGIFTFLGPQGIGKTLLAESFARVLEGVEGEVFPFKRFDMSLYANWSDFQVLFGGSESGQLTGFVDQNPRCVLLFDEIEKALPELVQALLPMLDSGMVHDKALKKPVLFREAWVIFTTNLGREWFDKAAPLGRGAAVSAEAFDLLASARSRKDIRDREAAPALSPEFVSRLTKGGAVIFSRLEAHHYLELVEQGLQAHRSRISKEDSDLPRITADQDAQLLFLLSLAPTLDARKVATRSRAWAMDLLREALAEVGDDLRALGTAPFSLEVVASTMAKAFLADRMAPLQLTALIIDEDLRTFQVLQPVLAEQGAELIRCAGTERLEESLAHRLPDFILLDLSIHRGPSSSDVEPAMGVLEQLKARYPKIPVYLFSENPDRRAAFLSITERALRKGGARDFIPYLRNANHPVMEESFAARIREIAHALRLERLCHSMERSRVQVGFHSSFSLDASRNRVRVELDGLTEDVVVTAGDCSEEITFAGIPPERFSDVVGLDRAKERLQQVLVWIRDPCSLRALGGHPPRGYLLSGPPGCGKTLLARAFAGEAGFPFLQLAGGELTSRFYGETEAKIRRVFELARKYAPAIIFIDEIDGIALDRSALQGENQWIAGVVNQLLSCMDGFSQDDRPVFVLAATNHEDHVDPALRRPGRFDEVIPLDLPSFKARLSFFRQRLAHVPGAGGVDMEDLARSTVGQTPAYLDRLVREAIYLAAAQQRTELHPEDFQEAKHRVLYGHPAEIEVNSAELELTAHHEAGHATARIVLFPGRRIDCITIRPTENGVLGFVASFKPEDRHSLSLADIRSELTVLLAGREAERRLKGEEGITTGASNDLEKATTLALHAVTTWGMDEEVGPIVLPLASRGVEGVQARVRAMLTRAQGEAHELLQTRQDLHGKIVRELLDQQSIRWERLEALLREA